MTAENILEITRLFCQLEQEADTCNAECRVQVLFQDGERADLRIISTTHLISDATLIAEILVPNGAVDSADAIEFSLEDVQEVANYESQHCIFLADHR